MFKILGRLVTGDTDLAILFQDPAPPDVFVETIGTVNKELLNHLKRDPKLLHGLNARVFEELVAELLASFGWEVDLTTRTRDGGYDIFAIRKDITGVVSSWLVECKRWRPDNLVGIDIARGLYGVKNDLHVGMAMLATTTHFTRGVHEFKASRYDLELRDFEGIVDWINRYRPHPGGRLYVEDRKVIVPVGAGCAPELDR